MRPERPAEARPLRNEVARNEAPRSETPPTVQEIRRLLERTAAQQASTPAQRSLRPAEPRPVAPRIADTPRNETRNEIPRPEAPRNESARKSSPSKPSLTESLRQMLPSPADLLRRAGQPQREEVLREPVRETLREPAREPSRPAAQAVREPQPRQNRPVPPPNAAHGLLAGLDLQKSYGGRRVVNGVSLNVARGEAVGLLGPNGAGKTTVFYMVTGLVKADAGKIELDGNDVTQLPMYRRARLGIGYLPQEASIFRGLTVEDNILAVLEFVEPDRDRRMDRLNALLDEFKLHKVRKSPSIALSGGERRRCEIARSLATNPSFMLLDEPFAGIDPIAVGDIQELVTLLTQRGIGVLITDHNVRETLGLVNRAYIVHSGTILMEGNPEEIVESRDVRRLYLGEEFRL